MVSSRNCRLFFQQSPRNCRKGLFSIKGFSASQWFYSKFFDRYLICQPSGTELGFRPLLITRVRTGWDMNHVKYKKAIASRSLTRNRLLYVKIPDILQYKRSVWYLSSRQRNISWVFRIWMKIFKKCRVIGPRSPPSHISMIFIDKILSNYPVQSPLPPVGRYLKFSTFYPTRARLLYTWLQRLHHMAWEFESIIAAVINLTYSLPKDIKHTHYENEVSTIPTQRWDLIMYDSAVFKVLSQASERLERLCTKQHKQVRGIVRTLTHQHHPLGLHLLGKPCHGRQQCHNEFKSPRPT